MRELTLIRHGTPVPLDGQRRCVSRTELVLSEDGVRQAQQCALALGNVKVFTSPRLRCLQTASILGSGKPEIRQALQEVEVGLWEGLTFDEIAETWPREYAERGQHMARTAPPGGESFLQAGIRLQACLEDILRSTEGNPAVVTHCGIARGFLVGLLGIPEDDILSIRQPCGGMTTLTYDGTFHVKTLGLRPFCPTAEDVQQLYRMQGTPVPVQEHCKAVRDTAILLLERTGAACNREQLEAAALLHDLCRVQGRTHPRDAARVLDREGWPDLAEIVAQHHDAVQTGTEAELLALADRLTAGTERVSASRRFAESYQKCRTDEARAAWEQRRAATLALLNRYGISEEERL